MEPEGAPCFFWIYIVPVVTTKTDIESAPKESKKSIYFRGVLASKCKVWRRYEAIFKYFYSDMLFDVDGWYVVTYYKMHWPHK